MKILVLGSNGMAGHVIAKYLRQQGHLVVTAARDNCDMVVDIENISSADILFSSLTKYNFVVNCIGLLVKDSINRPDRAAIVNAWFPHYLENILKETNTKLIHLSTDCVFDGKTGPYVESDIHTEMNSYGRSKSLGEVNNNKDITFRMSIIGPEIRDGGSGLLNWVIANTQDKLPGWDNAWWNGITTLQLAKCIDQYINNPATTGIYHLVNNNVNINKFDLLCKINEIFNLRKTIIRTQGPKSVNKILVDTRNEIDFAIPDYDVQLRELRDF